MVSKKGKFKVVSLFDLEKCAKSDGDSPSSGTVSYDLAVQKMTDQDVRD